MVNIILTYACNRDCDYCFSKGKREKFSQEMDIDNLDKILGWLKKSSETRASLLGGEPSIYSRFGEAIDLFAKHQIYATIFTNALFEEGAASVFSKPIVQVIVVNIGKQEQYSEKEYKLIQKNLSSLSKMNKKIVLSINFISPNQDFSYLFTLCEKYSINHIRFDVAKPSGCLNNAYVSWGQMKSLIPTLVDFVEQCRKKNITTTFDCIAHPCLFTPQQWQEVISNCSLKTICMGPIEINPDMSADFCPSLSELVFVENIFKYEGFRQLRMAMHQLVREKNLICKDDECLNCEYLKISCQGKCFAYQAIGEKNEYKN